jgi:DNA polymerase-3 subunit epsilon
MARGMHPGKKNSLDALCNRYLIDRSGRQVHGALIDADLLAKVYLAMTGGQETLNLVEKNLNQGNDEKIIKTDLNLSQVYRKAGTSELEAHEEFLDKMTNGSGCLWREKP